MKVLSKRNPPSKYRRNVHSQFGEDGILEYIFEILGVKEGWSVEFGAADGVWFSNTHRLLKNRGWKGVLIEIDPQKYSQLKKTYRNCNDVHCFNLAVNFEGSNTLDKIFSKTPLPRDFDFLSIDVDGIDYQIWDSLKSYEPKVVIIEYNPTIPDAVKFVQEWDINVCHGSSLAAMIELGKKKGYELVATTLVNGIFVKKEFYDAFEIEDNSIELMRHDRELETHLFQLYDGTIMVEGNQKLVWDETPFNTKKWQVYPKSLRGLHITSRKRRLRAIWRRFFHRR